MASTLSIIIPTYNSAPYIVEAIESVLCQNYKEYEVYVVDDGSTDNTKETLERYVSKGQIYYFYQPNQGPTNATNVGIKKSKGKYITFLDADDILAPNCLQMVVSFMEKHSEVGYVFGNYEIFNEKGIINKSGVDTWKIFRRIPHDEVEPETWIFTEILTKYIIKHGSFMATSGVTFRRDLLDEVDLLREGYFYGYDDEFYARLTYRCKSGYINKVLSRIRNRSGSLRFDRSKQRRNTSNLIEHAESLKDYFRDDKEIQKILEEKIPNLVYDLCWGLQGMGDMKEAQQILCQYLMKYKSWPLLKLLVKNYLIRMHLL